MFFALNMNSDEDLNPRHLFFSARGAGSNPGPGAPHLRRSSSSSTRNMSFVKIQYSTQHVTTNGLYVDITAHSTDVDSAFFDNIETLVRQRYEMDFSCHHKTWVPMKLASRVYDKAYLTHSDDDDDYADDDDDDDDDEGEQTRQVEAAAAAAEAEERMRMSQDRDEQESSSPHNHNRKILKMSGIWENEREVGISYGIYYSRRIEKS